MVPQQGHSLFVQQPWKGAHFSKSRRARHTSRVTFLHTLWITNQPPMLFIDPNTPWNRASLSYLRDMQHTHKLFHRNQNTLDDIASKSKHRRSLSLSALLSVSACVCMCVVNLVAKKVQFCVLDSGTPASWMCICISLSVCQCLCAGSQRLCCCRLFLGGVWFTHYSIFLLLCQSHERTGCCDWLGEEKERTESGDGWPEGGFSRWGRWGEEGGGEEVDVM